GEIHGVRAAASPVGFITISVVEISLHLDARAIRPAPRQAAQRVDVATAIGTRLHAGGPAQPGQLRVVVGMVVDAESALLALPTVPGGLAVGQGIIVGRLVAGVDAIVGALADPPAVTHAAVGLVDVADRAVEQPALRVPGAAGHDVDHAVDRVGPPHRGSGTADDFNAIQILQHRLLQIPINPGENLRINRAT